jgi:Protein of unknown function (DUF3135)
MVFNFDEWAQLYKSDPAEFERRRKEVISEAIAAAPAAQQLKLHQLQWKLDAIHTTNTPIGAMLKMQSLMWESFLNMADQMNALSHALTPPPSRPNLRIVK